MPAYYNENDPKAAAWLRELIKRDLIAPGTVDERSIEDVTPIELNGFNQCHFFAGIGTWSYALRRAGYADDQPIWTGSCPCQPFSAAGKGGGFDDERHLWPAFFHLIKHGKQKSVPVIGEQVASKDGLAWLDLVQSDMEGEGYAFGAVDTCAAGFGAPHIRQRLYWVADSQHAERRAERGIHSEAYGGDGLGWSRNAGELGIANGTGRQQRVIAAPTAGHGDTPVSTGIFCELGDAIGAGLEGHAGNDRSTQGRTQQAGPAPEAIIPDPLADSARHGRREECADFGGIGSGDRPQGNAAGLGTGSGNLRPGPTNGMWRDADWLYCRDGKWRPVESGTFPLVNGLAGRVGLLRGYGNGIVAEQAQAFIEAVMEAA